MAGLLKEHLYYIFVKHNPDIKTMEQYLTHPKDDPCSSDKNRINRWRKDNDDLKKKLIDTRKELEKKKKLYEDLMKEYDNLKKKKDDEIKKEKEKIMKIQNQMTERSKRSDEYAKALASIVENDLLVPIDQPFDRLYPSLSVHPPSAPPPPYESLDT